MIDLIIESLRSGDFRATARHHGTTIAWRDASTAKAALLAVLSEACHSHRCGNGKFDMTHLQPNAEALAIMAEAGLIQAEAARPVAGEAVDWAVVGPKLAEAAKYALLLAVRRQADGGDLLDFQDTLRTCADKLRPFLRYA